MKIGIIAMLLCLSSLLYAKKDIGSKEFESKVKKAVVSQMKLYPESKLCDLYKNFFQDRFGPGHLIADTASAGDYLRRELSSYDECSGPVTESCGWEGIYYRVNLSVLKENKIPYTLFFHAFIESVNNIHPPAVEEWKTEWGNILAVIEKMQLNLPDFQSDKNKISQLLQSGDYVMHHSEWFNKHYQPHYRIIKKDIYDKQLKKFIEK